MESICQKSTYGKLRRFDLQRNDVLEHLDNEMHDREYESLTACISFVWLSVSLYQPFFHIILYFIAHSHLQQ